MTKPKKWHVRPAKTQISLGVRPVWSESLLSAWRKLGSLATHWALSEDSDQTGRIWVFAGRTATLMVLACRGSNILAMGLYYFHHNISLNRAMLTRSYKAFKGDDGTGELLLPTRVGGTRWIGHTYRAIANLTYSYKFICAHLNQVKYFPKK